MVPPAAQEGGTAERATGAAPAKYCCSKQAQRALLTFSVEALRNAEACVREMCAERQAIMMLLVSNLAFFGTPFVVQTSV